MPAYLKPIMYVLAGALTASLVITTSALAGSGVGATLNLGQANGVNAQTVWRGNPGANAELRLENNGTGPALSLLTAPGIPPFKVTSQARVGGLNADFVDGVDGERLWTLGGNAGTSPGTDFLGTTDNEALELKVNGQRALRLEPTAPAPGFIVGFPNLVGGYSQNAVQSGAVGATISGGGGAHRNAPAAGISGCASGDSPNPNTVSDNFGTVGGGSGNRAGDSNGFYPDTAPYATVGGGELNLATAGHSTVGGGSWNSAGGVHSTVSGGFCNDARGDYATVPGGFENLAASNSFAAGTQARATWPGSFVWGDNTPMYVTSPGANTFSVRASGGIWLGTTTPSITAGHFIDTSTGGFLTSTGVWTNASDRALKHDLRPLKTKDVLDKVARMPITNWSYKAEQPGIRHIGPMAQDFYSAFGLGLDDKHITTIDEGGVALAAIQGLYRQNRALQRQNRSLNARLTKLERAFSKLSR